MTYYIIIFAIIFNSNYYNVILEIEKLMEVNFTSLRNWIRIALFFWFIFFA